MLRGMMYVNIVSGKGSVKRNKKATAARVPRGCFCVQAQMSDGAKKFCSVRHLGGITRLRYKTQGCANIVCKRKAFLRHRNGRQSAHKICADCLPQNFHREAAAGKKILPAAVC